MKLFTKVGFGALLLLLGMGSAMAEITSTGTPIKKEGYGPYYIYPSFTYDGRTQFYVEIQGPNPAFYDEYEKVGIYDAGFSHIKTLDVPTFPTLTTTYSYQPAINGPIGVVENGSFYAMPVEINDKEEAWRYLEYTQDWKEVEENGETRFYFNEDSDRINDFYFYYGLFGRKYPAPIMYCAITNREAAIDIHFI